MSRRVFLSVLGVAFYETCRYRKDDFTGGETLFVQKSLLEYLQQQENWGGENDLVLMLLTDLARKNNWDRNLKTRFCAKLQQEVAYQGLEKILLDMNLSYLDIAIPDGKDGDQMWEIFEVIFDKLQEGDELYLDITNSFRYLPMLLVVLVNYAKLLKNVKVKAIFYGNYEARDKESNIAPIMDLLPLSVLQDWTLAASDYLRYGQVEKLFELSESSLLPILRNTETRTKDAEKLRSFVTKLKEMVEERTTCRGYAIVGSKNVRKLKCTASEIQKVTIVQLRPIFEKIKQSLNEFDAKENVLNCIKAAKWCCANKLYQQATTMLEEGLGTFLCCHYQLDYRNKANRDAIFGCISIKTQNKDTEENTANKELVEKILADDSVWGNKAFVTILQKILELRNDYNHAGFKKNPFSAQKVIETIEELLDGIEEVLSEI